MDTITEIDILSSTICSRSLDYVYTFYSIHYIHYIVIYFFTALLWAPRLLSHFLILISFLFFF